MSDILDDKTYIEELRQQLAELKQQLGMEREAHQRAFDHNTRFLKQVTVLRKENATMRAMLIDLLDDKLGARQRAEAYLAPQEPDNEL